MDRIKNLHIVADSLAAFGLNAVFVN